MIWVIAAQVILIFIFGWWGLLFLPIIFIVGCAGALLDINKNSSDAGCDLSNHQSSPITHKRSYSPKYSPSQQAELDRLDALLEETDRKLEEIQAENREWERQQGYFWAIKRNGETAETNSDIYSAIDYYEDALAFAYKSEYLKSNNYCSTMERLVILYSKTKQFDKEVEMIEAILQDAPNSSIRKKYEDRLPKALKRMQRNEA